MSLKTKTAIITMDAADKRAKQRSLIGAQIEIMTPRTKNYINPSVGGSMWFPLWLRRIVMGAYPATENVNIAANTAHCRPCTMARLAEKIEPFWMTCGNDRVDMTGSDQCCSIWRYVCTIKQQLIKYEASLTQMVVTPTPVNKWHIYVQICSWQGK